MSMPRLDAQIRYHRRQKDSSSEAISNPGMLGIIRAQTLYGEVKVIPLDK